MRFRAKVVVSFPGQPPIDTHSINLSVGGMSVELQEPPGIGSLLRVRLDLSDGVPVELAATVRYSTTITAQGPGIPVSVRSLVGIQFKDVKPETAKLIEQALEDLDAD